MKSERKSAARRTSSSARSTAVIRDESQQVLLPKGVDLGSKAFLDQAAEAFNTLQDIKFASTTGRLSRDYFDDFFVNLTTEDVDFVGFAFVTVTDVTVESKTSTTYKLHGMDPPMAKMLKTMEDPRA